MLDKMKVEEAIRSGLAAICAWCEHYWEATAQKPAGHSGCVKSDCGGPLNHKTFPEYKGPWAIKIAYCFICGKKADTVIEIPQRGMLGVCHEHILKFIEIVSANGEPVNLTEKKFIKI